MALDLPQLRWLAAEYYDLNGSHIDILEEPPTALEFLRLVNISRPVLIRGVQIPSVRLWDNEYLAGMMKDQEISIAVTPNGRADAVTQAPDGQLYFLEPHLEKMSMSDFLAKLSDDDANIHYLQSQNGNVYSSQYFQGAPDTSEFQALRCDIPSEIKWCSEALGKTPDAVNLWIGDHRSVTSIHSDPYENIYTVVRGSKLFTLLPPTEGWCLKERLYPHGSWTRTKPDEPLTIAPSLDAPPVRWASIVDPHVEGNLPPEAHPIHITVNTGETLYLPPGWWHHVRQADDTISLNWWYDVEMRGLSWAVLGLLRGNIE